MLVTPRSAFVLSFIQLTGGVKFVAVWSQKLPNQLNTKLVAGTPWVDQANAGGDGGAMTSEKRVRVALVNPVLTSLASAQ